MISRRLMILSVSMSLGLPLALPARAQENYLAEASLIRAPLSTRASSSNPALSSNMRMTRLTMRAAPSGRPRSTQSERESNICARRSNSQKAHLDKRISKATEQAELALRQFESVKQ